MQAFLEVQSSASAQSRIPLRSNFPLRIGRRAEADHSFPDDKQMSGLHFAIELTGKGWRLLDLNSSNGTFLNGARVKEATLANGDEIRAGSTTFVLRMLREGALPAAKPLAAPPEPAPEKFEAPKPAPALKPGELPSFSAASGPGPLKPGELPSFPVSAPAASSPVAAPPPKLEPAAPKPPRLQDLLREEFQPLYALLDASREPSVLKVIFESKEEYQSLYEGAQGQQLAHFAPYLIRIPEKSPLIETLINQAWSKSWGVFLTCDKPLKDLRTHFRHFLSVKLPDGKQVYFRYYDPRVLRLFLPTCQPEEINQFFGPIKQFLMEAEDPKLALHFTRGPRGATQRDLQLAPA